MRCRPKSATAAVVVVLLSLVVLALVPSGCGSDDPPEDPQPAAGSTGDPAPGDADAGTGSGSSGEGEPAAGEPEEAGEPEAAADPRAGLPRMPLDTFSEAALRELHTMYWRQPRLDAGRIENRLYGFAEDNPTATLSGNPDQLRSRLNLRSSVFDTYYANPFRPDDVAIELANGRFSITVDGTNSPAPLVPRGILRITNDGTTGPLPAGVTAETAALADLVDEAFVAAAYEAAWKEARAWADVIRSTIEVAIARDGDEFEPVSGLWSEVADGYDGEQNDGMWYFDGGKDFRVEIDADHAITVIVDGDGSAHLTAPPGRLTIFPDGRREGPRPGEVFDPSMTPEAIAEAKAAAEMRRRIEAGDADAWWAEAKDWAGSLRVAVDIWKVMNQPTPFEPFSGTWPEAVDAIGLEEAELPDYLSAEDFHVELKENGDYTVTVDGTNSANPRAARGVFTINHKGETTGP
jgi:hypothetical protein